jgi:hypothetical protein
MEIFETIMLRFLGSAFIALGVCLMILLERGRRIGVASRQWPHTEGIVLESSLQERMSGHSAPVYSVKVRYRYEVAGIEHEGDTFSYQGIDAHKETPTKIVESLPKGQPVDVYYDPATPTKSVLLPGAKTGGYAIGFAMGVGFAAIGFYFAIFR